MDEKALARMLRAEGFSHTYVWEDRPNAHYPDHTHAGETAHIVLSGEMTLTMGGSSETCREGDRCDVAGGVVHSARMLSGVSVFDWRALTRDGPLLAK